MQPPSGKFIRCSGNYRAYIPDPSPPPIDWNVTIVNSLSDADRLLGYLSGEGGRLPNPHVLIRPLIAREAVLSRRIEGTVTTLRGVLAANAGAAIETNLKNLKEVNNYNLSKRNKKSLKNYQLLRRLAVVNVTVLTVPRAFLKFLKNPPKLIPEALRFR